ncbi:MAG: hypothetical protein M3N24_09445 [Actinomycetota bacterium]|nr:hypothetical protein [Actinomycetota bacterium]
MSNDAPKLGTGLFGFRRSAVQEIMAEGEARLREAEERLRAAEMRVSELQQELDTLKRRNAQMNQEMQRFEAEDAMPGPDESPEPVQSGRGSWEGELERQ